jgi:hypothetical protein
MPMNLSIGLALGSVTTGGRGFTPASLSPLAAWWDASLASTVTLNVADVASIADVSGNSRTASQATGAEQPAYNTATGINSKNVIAFTGANNDGLSIASALGIGRNNPGITVEGIIRLVTPSATNRILTMFSSAGGSLLNIQGASNSLQVNSRRIAADTIDSKTTIATLSANTAHFFAVSVNYATGSVIIVIDGTARTQTAAWVAGAASEDVDASTAPLIGRQSTNVITGDIGEMVVRRVALTAAQIDTLRTGYYKPKWGTA